jgi:hypothetical protein
MDHCFGISGAVCASAVRATAVLPLIFACVAANADFLGARIAVPGTTVSIEQPDDNPENEVTRFLMGPSGAVAAFIHRIDTAQTPGSAASVTVFLESTEEGRHVFRTSRSGGSTDARDESFAAATPGEFAAALCRISFLCGAPRGAAPAGTAGAPPMSSTLEFATNRANAQIVVQLGEFPAAAREILLRSTQEAPAARAPSAGAQDPLSALIYRTVQEVARPDPAPAPAQVAGAPAQPNKPIYFAVHCTAFYTSVASAERWVKRLRQEGRRAKSHGVILENGDYKELWPLSERPVYATKTETCPETRAGAMGSIINVELHYFCGYDGRDLAVLKEATPAQYKTLAELYLKARELFGELVIVSHKEIDRGLRDGHQDPIGFSFETFLLRIRELQPGARPCSTTDARQRLPSTPDYSHTWQPNLDKPLVREALRPDDCKRDSRMR